MKRLRTEEKGAAMVEFALSAILLFTLLFGIIEAAWGFANLLDVRHGVREGARVAAVVGTLGLADATAEVNAIRDAACDTIDIPADVVITHDGNQGSTAVVELVAPHQPLTGFIAALNNITLKDDATILVEQDAQLNVTTTTVPCP